MTDPFLSRDVVQRITGKVRGQAQLRQLRRQGIRVLVNESGEPVLDADGYPLVPRDAVALADVHNLPFEPDWSKLRRAG